ncbi:flavodoxin [Alkalitalea saponilacus]|uniref:Flavodoxin n=1 Tax=Alkalitalea saponilacus TaxID=889453 RepID=A0A1T5DBU9_9BACT|nr:flavodoxin [Alkalitalea saponilacus]ASB50653.1 flavodoxin [Alkalitalea saponilacus]SKB69101.1 flavodoxin I [Alkalitalea saponilacus]
MEKIGIFYSFRSVKTQQQVKKIKKALGEKNCEDVDADVATLDDFKKYKNYILAVPTWFDGELPNYWDEYLPAIEDESFKGKKFAIFGGGDQKNYPENFIDGVGIMAEFIEERNGKVVGFTSADGYTYESSRAQRGDKFVGLAIDIENQAALTDERIKNWCTDLKKEFDLK